MVKKINDLHYVLSDEDCEELAKLNAEKTEAENKLKEKKNKLIKELQYYGVEEYFRSFEYSKRPVITINGKNVKVVMGGNTYRGKPISYSFFIYEDEAPAIVKIRGFDGKFQIERKVGSGRYLVKSTTENYYINNVWKKDIIWVETEG